MSDLADFGRQFIQGLKSAASSELQDVKQDAVEAGDQLLDKGISKLTALAVITVGGVLILQGLIQLTAKWLGVEVYYVTLTFGVVAMGIGFLLRHRKTNKQRIKVLPQDKDGGGAGGVPKEVPSTLP